MKENYFFFQDSQNNKNKTKQNIVKKQKNDDIQPTKLTSTPRPKDSTFRGYIYWTAESDCSQANICFFCMIYNDNGQWVPI